MAEPRRKSGSYQIQASYSFDRLLEAKLAQAYDILVPCRERPLGGGVKEFADEDVAEVACRPVPFPQRQSVFLRGNCPGKEESAEKNHNSRSAKGPKQGSESDPKMRKERARRLARALRRLGYDVAITPITLSPYETMKLPIETECKNASLTTDRFSTE